MAAKAFWISGSALERKLAFEEVKGQFPNSELLIAEGDFTVPYLEHLAKQESCFCEYRIVVIKNMPSFKGNRQTMVNQVKKTIDRLPDNCVFIFENIDNGEAIENHIKSVGKVYDSPLSINLNNGDIWVAKTMKEFGKEIDSDEANLLIETCGFDKNVNGIGVDLMRIACEKLSIYLGRRKKVTKDDILLTALPSQDFVIWRIFDAMDSRDICACYNEFGRLADQQGIEEAVNIVHSLSLSRYRMILFLKESIASGKSKKETEQAAIQFQKFTFVGKDWLMKLNNSAPAFNEKIIAKALHGGYGKRAVIELYSRKDVVKIINTLYDSSTEIRARNSTSGIQLLNDALFLSICTNIDDSVIRKMREPYNYV